jgi:amino-acid N-acetyltransferase
MTITTQRTVRPARAGDLQGVLDLVSAAGLPTGGIADRLDGGYAVAVEGGRLVGVAGVEVYAGWGLLRSVAVAPEARGTGLGVELARERVDWARGQGLAALFLLTTTAAGFFPRLGFAPVARDEVPDAVRGAGEFRGICPASAVVMVHPLGEG